MVEATAEAEAVAEEAPVAAAAVDMVGVVAPRMRRSNPKYIPREWMLAEGYRAAEKGDYAPLATLHEVLKHPYEEQPLFEGRFYKRAPDGSEQQGGIGFMS